MFGFAFRNLRSRPARSLLALAGLTVAIAGMVGLFSVAEGLNASAEDAFSKVDGLTALQPGAPVPLLSRIPARWEPAIEAVPGAEVVVTDVWNRVNVIDGKTIVSPPRFLLGTDIPDRVRLKGGVYRDALKSGRFLSADDVGTTNVYCAKGIAEEFEKTVGDVLTLDGTDCRIVGTYEVGSLFLDAAILMDLGTMRRVTRFDPDTVSNYYIEPAAGTDPEALKDAVRAALAGETLTEWVPSLSALTGGPEPTATALFDGLDTLLRGGEAPPAASASRSKRPTGEGDAPVELRTMDEWVEEFDSFTADLDLFLSILGATGVLIAVFGVVNTMLMSVSERIIEFGILKANGWSRGDVLRLICSESLILGVLGGVLGAAVGWAATLVLNGWFPDRLNLYAGPGLLGFAVAFSAVVGTLGGLYPAVWAMRMQPMDAIRRG